MEEREPSRTAVGRAWPVGVFAGLATLDMISRVDRLPGPDEKVTARSQEVAAGGPAANAAVTFAALGGQARLVTALGKGRLAGLVLDDLRRHGVDVVDVAADLPEQVPVSSVMVDDATGERAVVGGETVRLDLPELPPRRCHALLGTASVLLVDGHHPAVATGMALAARGRVPAVLDAGRWKESMVSLLPLVDDVVTSAAFRVPGAETAQATASALLGDGASVVVTTAGPGPVRWWESGRVGRVEVPAVRAVDTLAAGDAFHGAYAWARANARALEERLALAVRVAAHRTTVVGARRWLVDAPRVAGPI